MSLIKCHWQRFPLSGPVVTFFMCLIPSFSEWAWEHGTCICSYFSFCFENEPSYLGKEWTWRKTDENKKWIFTGCRVRKSWMSFWGPPVCTPSSRQTRPEIVRGDPCTHFVSPAHSKWLWQTIIFSTSPGKEGAQLLNIPDSFSLKLTRNRSPEK